MGRPIIVNQNPREFTFGSIAVQRCSGTLPVTRFRARVRVNRTRKFSSMSSPIQGPAETISRRVALSFIKTQRVRPKNPRSRLIHYSSVQPAAHFLKSVCYPGDTVKPIII